MEKKENGNSSGKRAVKDLPLRKGQDVKGGQSNMMKKLNEISMAVINNLR